MKNVYLIQGIIFQKGYVLGLGEKPGIGTAVLMQNAMNYAMFQAVVGPSEDGESFCGQMHDKWGDSEITELIIEENFLQFVKKYRGRPPILYSFKEKEGEVWNGIWTGDDCGAGKTKCIIVPVEESFFGPNN